eukprot:SAG11_NODE_3219_length_2602_cov_19.561726_1_plen_25_part_10
MITRRWLPVLGLLPLLTALLQALRI